MSFSTTYNRSGRSNCFHPLPLGDLVGGLVGTARAAWPVWRDSTRKEVKFHPLPKKKAARLYHEARRFERRTRTKGKQDGALGRNGLKVLETLIFDFLNYFTGRTRPLARGDCQQSRNQPAQRGAWFGEATSGGHPA